MEDIKDLQCCVCIQVYSDHAPPKNFKCGHSICLKCLKELGSCPECPECRTRCSSKEAKELSTNISLLRLCRLHAYVTASKDELPPIELDIKCPKKEPLSSEGTCPAHGHSMFFSCLTCDVPVCRGCLISDHPDQPFGRCVIVSIREKRKATVKKLLETLNSHLDQSKETKKRMEKVLKGSKNALQYWERNEKVKSEENYEKDLQEIRTLHEAAEKDVQEATVFQDFFTECSSEMSDSKSLSEIHDMFEKAQKKYVDFQNFQKTDRKEAVLKYLQKFWKSGKLVL